MFKKFAVIAAAAIAMIVPTAGAASAGELEGTELCYVVLVVDKNPGVILENGRVGVETGEYHVEQNCVYIDPR